MSHLEGARGPPLTAVCSALWGGAVGRPWGCGGGSGVNGGCPSLWGYETISDAAEEAEPAKGLQNLGWCQSGPRASGLGLQEPSSLGRAAWWCVSGELGKSAPLAPPGPLL